MEVDAQCGRLLPGVERMLALIRFQFRWRGRMITRAAVSAISPLLGR